MKLKIVKFKSVRSTNDEAIKLIRSNKYLLGLASADKIWAKKLDKTEDQQINS